MTMYHIDRVVEEIGMPFEDASNLMYVNRAYRGDDPLGRLMHDFSCTDDMNYGKLSDKCVILRRLRSESYEQGYGGTCEKMGRRGDSGKK